MFRAIESNVSLNNLFYGGSMKISTSMFSTVAIGLLMCTIIFTAPLQAATVCTDCSPQCTAYAMSRSGLKCNGNAGNWSCSNGKGADYPTTGDVIELSSPGHVIYVEKADKKKCKDGKCNIDISHANWQDGCHGKKCPIATNVSARYEKGHLTFSGKTHPVKKIWKKK